MLRKVAILFSAFFVLVVACQKDCTTFRNLETTEYTLKVNGENKGLFPDEGVNAGDTIRSVRNQFYATFLYKDVAQQNRKSLFIQEAYAKDCPVLNKPITLFQATSTKFSVNVDVDLSFWGLEGGIIPAGTDLFTIDPLRTRYLQVLRDNYLLQGSNSTPITLSVDFLKYFNKKSVAFTLVLITPTGKEFSSTANAFVDINA